MSRVAVVVVRFGAQITGGAELHARQVAMRLARRGHDVTVLTTCAEDYVSWANVIAAGESRDGPLRVVRFPVRAERDLGRWEAAMQPILRGCWDADDEERVLREAGPDAPQLLDHLRSEGASYDAVIFFTLLYLPAVAGIPLVHDRAILVPTLHEEVAATLQAQARALRLARFVMWNSPEERGLAARMYDVEDLPGAIAGVGVEPPQPLPDPGAMRDRYGLERPYLLYAGRVDRDKGCDELLRFFTAWAIHDPRADLVLAGRAWMDIPAHSRIRHLGFVETPDLWALMSGAVATVVPSRRESLSMVTLESMAAGTPVLARAGSPPVEGHVRRGAAGLVYADTAEFAAGGELLLDQPETAAALGRDGQRYVAANFSWERVEAVYEEALAGIARRRTRLGAPA
jgi:glycosyltransferase involved in cell wall biosynthesis